VGVIAKKLYTVVLEFLNRRGDGELITSNFNKGIS
jgi:hypothetical protein